MSSDAFRDPASINRLQELLRFLRSFIVDPVGTMKTPIQLSYPAAISLQAGSAMISGAVAGAFGRNFWDFLTGLLLFPISSVVIGFVFSIYLHYFYSLFMSTYLDFRRLYSIVVVSMVPYFFLHVLSGFLAPIDLIGFALSCVLMIVGLVEQFGLERRGVFKIIGLLYAAFFLVWSIAQVQLHETERSRAQKLQGNVYASVFYSPPKLASSPAIR